MVQKLGKNRAFSAQLISDIRFRVLLPVPVRSAAKDAIAAGLGSGVAVHRNPGQPQSQKLAHGGGSNNQVKLV